MSAAGFSDTANVSIVQSHLLPQVTGLPLVIPKDGVRSLLTRAGLSAPVAVEGNGMDQRDNSVC
jgi:hypothetical protein